MNDHDFCRLMWKRMKPFFNEAIPEAKERKKCWAYIYDGKQGEWHGPNRFFWAGNACCKWMAKYYGFEAYLKKNHHSLWVKFDESQEVLDAMDEMDKKEKE